MYISKSLNFQDEFAKTSTSPWLASTNWTSEWNKEPLDQPRLDLLVCSLLPPRGAGNEGWPRWKRNRPPFKIYTGAPDFPATGRNLGNLPLFYFPNFRGERVWESRARASPEGENSFAPLSVLSEDNAEGKYFSNKVHGWKINVTYYKRTSFSISSQVLR